MVDEAAIRMNDTYRRYVTRKDGEAYRMENIVPKMMSAKASFMA